MCLICSDSTYVFSTRQAVQLNKQLNIDSIVERAVNQLYDDRVVDDKTRRQLINSHYQPLKQATEEGYGKQIAKIEYGTPNYEFLKQLQINTATFAAFKSHACIKEWGNLLKDADGNLRSREDYKREALKIDAKYRTDYLDTEYDTGVRSARMAANWQRYQRNKRLYPNLRYVMTKAAKPDVNHLAYVGIVRPIDDDFWNANYPPNRWRCQCGVEPTADDATDIPDKLPPVAAEFAFNSGKTGQVFDLQNSQYIKSVPPKEQPALIRDAVKIVNNDIAATIDYQPLYNSKKGGTVYAHPMSFDNQDFDEVRLTARKLANTFKDTVKILPDPANPVLRKALLPEGVKGNSSPDYLINSNMVADLKTISTPTKKAITGAVERCYRQCNNLLLSFSEDVEIDSTEIIRFLKGKLNMGYSGMKEVWIEYKGEWYKTTREQILNGWKLP